jgi:glutaredoxin
VYAERDITKDPAAIEELRRLGVMTTPVIVIDGQVVIGFDERRLDDLLGGAFHQDSDARGSH